jgi:hypothetical protein
LLDIVALEQAIAANAREAESAFFDLRSITPVGHG